MKRLVSIMMTGIACALVSMLLLCCQAYSLPLEQPPDQMRASIGRAFDREKVRLSECFQLIEEAYGVPINRENHPTLGALPAGAVTVSGYKIPRNMRCSDALTQAVESGRGLLEWRVIRRTICILPIKESPEQE